jgi:Flp pilus assembly protein TadB
MMAIALFLVVLTAASAATYVTYEVLLQKENKTLHFAEVRQKTAGMQKLSRYVTRHKVMALVFAAALLLLLLGHYLLAPMLVLGAIVRLQNLRSKRRKEIVKNLPGAIAIMTRSMRAGQTIEQSMNSILDFTGSKETRAFFKRVLQMVYISGKPTHEVLLEQANRNRLNEVAMLASILESHAQVGGNITEVLSIFEEQMRRTMVTQKKIISLMTEGRTSIIILAAIPLLVLGAVLNFTPDYLGFFLREEGRFGLMLIVLFYLFGIGSSILFVRGR